MVLMIVLQQLKPKLEFHLVNLMLHKVEFNIFYILFLYPYHIIFNQLYTAPFSSKSTSLKCCVQVLAQGKAAIMTIIEVFQYQLSVNGIKFAAVTIMFLEVQNFSEFQTVYVGFISNIPLLIFLCISSPATELAEYIPLDDQFSYQNQIQIYSNIFFAVLGLCIVCLINQLYFSQITLWQLSKEKIYIQAVNIEKHPLNWQINKN